MRIWLVSILLAWIGGIIAGSSGAPIWIAGCLMLSIGVWFGFRQPLPVAAAVLGLILLGAAWGTIAETQEPRPCRIESTQAFSGQVKQIWRYSSTQAQYLVSHPSGCRVLVTANRFPEWHVGDSLELSGRLQPVTEIAAPYQGYAQYLSRRGVAATLRFPQVMAHTSGRRSVRDVWASVDRRLHMILPEPEASVSAALLYGWQGTIPEEVQQRFRQTGVTHILAVSGMHVTIVVGALSVLGFLPLPRWLRLSLLMIAVWAYIWTIGAPVSAIRAGWFWMGLLAAWNIGRLASLPSVLLVSAAGMLGWQPLLSHDIGFQLSVGAVAGIWAALFLVRHWWQNHFPARPMPLLAMGIVSSLGASVVTGPIIVYHFGLISFVSVIANLLIVPTVPLYMGLIVFTLMTSLIAPVLAGLGSFGIHVVWQWWEAVTRFLTHVPGAYVEEASLPAWAVFMYEGLLIAAGIWYMWKYKIRWQEIWI